MGGGLAPDGSGVGGRTVSGDIRGRPSGSGILSCTLFVAGAVLDEAHVRTGEIWDVLEWLNDASKGDELGSFRSIEGFMVSSIMCGGDSFSGICECSTGGEARNCELARS